MTDEELQHIKRNGIMLKDAVYIVDKLIADVQQARKERNWLAETCVSVLCEITNKLNSKGLELSYPPTKEEILIEAKEATK